MREFGPVRKDLGDDQEASAPYIVVARAFLGNMKNRMRLGGLAQLAQRVQLPDGTIIDVASRHGQDTIRITPAVAGTPSVTPTIETYPSVDIPADEAPAIPQPDIPQLDIPVSGNYLLVVYNGNQIAAIPMTSLDSGSWPVVYKATLKNTALDSTTWYEVAQYHFGVPGANAMFVSPVSIQDNVLVADPNYKYWINVIKGNSSAGVRTQTSSGDPVFNASGSTVYGADGVYTVDQKTGTPSLVTSYSAAFGSAAPYAIGADGTYYFMAQAEVVGNRRGLTAGASVNVGFGYTPSAISSQWQSATLGPSASPNRNNGFVGSISFAGGGFAVTATAEWEQYTVTNPSTDSAAFVPVHNCVGSGDFFDTVTPDFSGSLPFPVYTKSGGVDRVDVRSANVSASTWEHAIWNSAFTYDGSGQTVYTKGIGTQHWTGALSMGPWSWAYDETQAVGINGSTTLYGAGPVVGSPTGYPSMWFGAFPPALSMTKMYTVVSDTSNNSVALSPYGNAGQNFEAWMHLSNGKTCLQAFYWYDADWNTVPALYVDGADCRAALQAAIKTDLSNVQLMLMDLPLTLIKQLK